MQPGEARPRTSHGALYSWFSHLENNIIRPAKSSIDLKRRETVDNSEQACYRDAGSAQSSLADHNVSRAEQRVLVVTEGFKRSLQMVQSGFRIRKNTSSRRGRDRTPADPLAYGNGSTSNSSNNNSPPQTPIHQLCTPTLRTESSSSSSSILRRPVFSRDRPRRNALSFHSGQSSGRSTQDLLEASQMQLPAQFTYGSGAAAKAAVAARQEERKLQLQTKQDDLMRQEQFRHVKSEEPMEVDSAFGDDSDEGIVMMSDSLPHTYPGQDPAAALPAELCILIMKKLDVQSLSRVSRVSKTWHQIVSSAPVWQAAYTSKFGPRSPRAYVQMGGDGMGLANALGQKSWQRMAKARKTIERNWHNSNGRAIYFQGHTDSVYCCQFDEEKIITGSRDRTIRVWDIHTYRCIKVIGGPTSKPTPPTNDVTLETVSATIYAGHNMNGSREGDAIFQVPNDYHSASILCLQYDKEIMVTGSSDTTCIVWDMKTYTPITRLRCHNAGVLDVCLDEKWIISCSKDHTICIWDRKTFELVKVLRGHGGPVNAVQLRHDKLVSASGDGRCKLWDLTDLEAKTDYSQVCVRTFQSGDRGLAAVEFSDDGKYILAGGNDQIIYKFAVSSGEVIAKFAGHTGLVRSLFLDYANRRVLSGSYDQGIRVFDLDDEKTPVGNYDNWTTSWILAAKSDYRRIVATSQDGRALMIDFGFRVTDAELLTSNGRKSRLE